ncbi:Type I phosphodiesterase / nucleotide pyrophosphatase [Flagellimonas taeanensis]|uniref:Type I phosphodiesterase / nucleotide pyrophosphatase n=1 Tax=Flagellimonas taeanensis TaxID=1005926 RepID=A0A1M6WXT1_9FLAO|nr:alkaline phosphatase family protein [Allomuricauda taeanensis]SFB99513.1 Type I phosphodiesterase / nucleotide pyrophosphatase [Allomuricauda taeanensis]SHK98484.1 Type I phosphodiesterase / nucleotide pyrophosphatase [Allomuricauda taeanensis]
MSKLTLFIGILVFGMVQAQNMEKDSTAKKVVFIIVDGISADQLKTADTPYLDQIGGLGGYTEAYVGGGKDTYSETPTISAVGYNSLITGTWANKHNVWGNEIKAPNYNYPTIFRLYKDQYPNGTIGVFSSWLDNRTKLVGDGMEETGGIRVDYHFDGLEHDSINFPHDVQRNFMKLIDYTVADHAAETILEKAPDVSWVYLEFSDDMGHGFGDGDRFNAAIHFEDKLIGKIWMAVEERQASHNEEWLFIVTTDHGRGAKDGKHHGGQSERERSTWIVTNSKQTNPYFNERIPAVVDILPTMTDFLEIKVPIHIRWEWDGVSLVQPVDAIDLKAKRKGNNLVVSWQNLSEGEGKLYLSGTNDFKSGGKDDYKFMDTVILGKGEVEIPMRKIPKGFCKLVLETEHTTLNTWFSEE